MGIKHSSTHPGTWLQQAYLKVLQVAPAQLAAHLQLPEAEVLAVLQGQAPVTLRMAHRLGAVLGLNPAELMGHQAAYDAMQLAQEGERLSLEPLESIFWGKDVAAFEHTVTAYHGASEGTCLVTLGFSKSGHAVTTFSQACKGDTPSVTMCVEHHAAGVFNKVVAAEVDDMLFEDVRGYAFFRERLCRARTALPKTERNLATLCEKGLLQWYEHHVEGSVGNSESLRAVSFTASNAPMWNAFADASSVFTPPAHKRALQWSVTRRSALGR